MNRSESKFKHTADKMDSALISLLENREFSQISIMDICQRAGVNRSTFYAHYDNTYDLLKETHRNLIANFMEECAFDSPVDISDMRILSKDDLNFITPKYLLPYLRYIKKHKRLCKIYADNARTFETNDTDDYLIENLFVPIYAKHGVTDKRLISYMQKYFLKGIDAIINEWVRNDCEDDIMFICEIITFCVRPMACKN
ncbi:MAG: TetR/AcrR family transcriptional regulator [Candidatus Scatosoma sp.]